MDFIDQLRTIASRLPSQLDHLQTEEATKTSLVMPFINALGYNIFDPTEVVPEYTADVGTKKGEKVDYAILKEKKPIILIECKWSGADLSEHHTSQLFRYFSVTDARFGVLTNGIKYRFYTDLEKPNKMDAKPFLEIDMLDLKEALVKELKLLTKESFDVEALVNAATELKYTKEIKRIMTTELESPSEEFVKFFASRVYSGRLTQSVKDQLGEVVKRSLQQFINDKINERLQSAIFSEEAIEEPGPEVPQEEAGQSVDETPSDIETTPEEIEGYHMVRAILSSVIEPGRVVMRDTKSYCGVLLDDNNRKPICRLRFNSKTRYIGLFDHEKNEEKFVLASLNDIYQYAERLKETVTIYGGGTEQQGEDQGSQEQAEP